MITSRFSPCNCAQLNKNSVKGITTVEILVVVFIIALFASILVIDLPKIARQFAITRAVYKMSQDLRKAQNMGLSGQQVKGINVKGYGVYINLDSSNLGNKKYIIYADINDNKKYENTDYIIETTDFSKTESGVIMDKIDGTTNDKEVDINFEPPNPTITITSLLPSINKAEIIFALESDLLKTRIVSINMAGLIEVK